MAKFFQEEEDEPNDMVRRMMDLVELQQIREQVGSSRGILSDRTRENMENLTLCGLALF